MRPKRLSIARVVEAVLELINCQKQRIQSPLTEAVDQPIVALLYKRACGLVYPAPLFGHAKPHSRLMTFSDGSDQMDIECYMHTDEYKPQGFYHEKKRHVQWSKPFRRGA